MSIKNLGIVAKFVVGVGALAASTPSAMAVESMTPRQASAMIIEEIQGLIAPSLPQDKWISLSIVGGVASEKDLATINHWSNSCLEPTPYLASLDPVRPLSTIYRKVLDGSVGPLRPDTQAIIDARELLQSDKKAAYDTHRAKYTAAFVAFAKREDDTNKQELLENIRLADRDWIVSGFKVEVGNAYALLEANASTALLNSRRREVLDDYIREGYSSGKYINGSFTAPVSEVSPPVSEWANEDGWVSLTYASKNTTKQTIERVTRKRGGGGFSLGFVKFGGSSGSTETEVTRVNTVRGLSYSFSVKRVSIRRPWLDTEVFFEPASWAWQKRENTPQRPNVALGLSAEGQPQPIPVSVYDNSDIACSMLPTDFILAKDIEIEVTVSKDDFRHFEKGRNESGGAVLFGFIGGTVGNNYSFKDVKEVGDAVSFTIEAKGISVIGAISHILPEVPNPNMADSWPENAWLEP